MAVNKNFVVKNGLEVKSNLLVADTSLDSVGIGTSFIKEKLHVQGGIGATTLFVGGIGTVHVATGNTARYENLNVTGLGTIATLSSNSINVVSLNASGIVTANKYFGDGSTLTGVSVGVRTEGAVLGYGVTFLDFRGAGVSTAFFNTNVGIATVFFQGGGSGGSVSISSDAPSNPNNGDLWYSIDFGRTFVYYDEVELGVGSTSVWVDASPFNNGGQFISAFGGTAHGAIGYTAGTASSTSIFFTGDPNTGVFQPTADQVSISAGGVGVATFNPGGFFVGGAATVTSDLSVSGNLNVTGDLVYDEERGANILISGVGTASGLNVLGISSTKDLNVVGVATIATLNVSTLNATSVTESENLTIQTGVTTNATNTNLTVTGITTIVDSKTQTGVTTNLTATNLTVTGITTLASATVTATSLTAATGVTTNATNTQLKVTGVSTFVSAATFSDDVTFTGANYNVTWDKSVDDLIFGDNAKAAFGASSDLTIYHDSSHSYISDQGTGSLKVLSSDFQVNNAANAENMITASEDGAAALYYNGTSRIQTTNSGINVTGTTTDDGATHAGDVNFTGDSYSASWSKGNGAFELDDNATIKIGNGADLKLYHDGSNSYIQQLGTGDLIIYGTGETLATFADDGAVTLYHNNSAKLATESGGIAITGGITLTTNISMLDNGELKIGTGDDLKLYHDGTDNYIEAASATLHFRVASGNRLSIDGTSGDISIQGASGKNVQWDNSAASLIFNDNAKAIFGTSSDGLELYHDGSGSYIDDTGTGSLIIQSNTVQINNAGGTEIQAKFIENGAAELYFDNSKKLNTTSVGVNITGNVDCDSLNNAGISTLSTTTFTGDVTFDGATAGRDIIFDRSDNALELADSAEIILGTGGDTQLHHDGSDSFVNHNGSGALCVRSNDLRLQAVDGVSYVRGYSTDDRVELYYGNSVKLASASGGVTVTGTCTATAFAGDGSALTGLSAGGGGEFNTSISEYANYTLTTSMATAFTANSSSSHRTIVHSVHITNIGGVDVTVSGEIQGTSKFAHLIPVPAGTSVELLKKPKVLGASETIELQSSAGSALSATIAAERQENTDLFGTAQEITSANVNTNIVTLSAAAVIESLLCVNDDGANDVKVRVFWTNASNQIQSYFAYDIIVPAGASVEILETPKAMPSGHKIRCSADAANRAVVIAALKYAS